MSVSPSKLIKSSQSRSSCLHLTGRTGFQLTLIFNTWATLFFFLLLVSFFFAYLFLFFGFNLGFKLSFTFHDFFYSSVFPCLSSYSLIPLLDSLSLLSFPSFSFAFSLIPSTRRLALAFPMNLWLILKYSYIHCFYRLGTLSRSLVLLDVYPLLLRDGKKKKRRKEEKERTHQEAGELCLVYAVHTFLLNLVVSEAVAVRRRP